MNNISSETLQNSTININNSYVTAHLITISNSQNNYDPITKNSFIKHFLIYQ
uniref:Uncharacterized protein n=1 Tax=Octopus bimaculoides TaxID=37653 RepID=A0A0L8HWK7_OCTBM